MSKHIFFSTARPPFLYTHTVRRDDACRRADLSPALLGLHSEFIFSSEPAALLCEEPTVTSPWNVRGPTC